MARFPQEARFTCIGGSYDVYVEKDNEYLIATEETMYNTFPAFACCWVREIGEASGFHIKDVVYEHVPADPEYLATLEPDDEVHAQLILAWYMGLCASIARENGDEDAAELYEYAEYQFRYVREC